MTDMTTRRALLAGLGTAALVPLLAAAEAPAPRRGPRANYFPNVVLQTHDGRQVRFYDDLMRGKVVVFNVMYAVCTGTCPANTANLLAVQEALGDRVGRDIFMYSLTLQPEMDTPRALREYAEKYGVKPGWTFLTGRRADMDLIRLKLGFWDKDPARNADLTRHTGMLRMGNEALDRWTMAPALTSVRQIVSSILSL